MLSRQYGVPRETAISEALNRMQDTFYLLPEIIECFIERANNELPNGFYVAPWTINRAVTIFKGKEPISLVTYEAIEDDIVSVLDRLPAYIA